MAEIRKNYEPQSVEDKWYDFWLKQGCFTADPARVSEHRPAYAIVIPPPNVTGMLHMGHVLNNTIQDILARKARMDGKEVLWLPGTDHAGISTEGMVEKQIRKEEKKSKREIGREEFLKRVWAWREKHGGIILQQLKKLGCSCDWTRLRFTMDEDYVNCVKKVFVSLYKKGLIYRGKRMINWCPATQTALSDEEVEMKPQKGFMYHFRVEAVEKDGTPVKVVGRPLTPALSPSEGARENHPPSPSETATGDVPSGSGKTSDARLPSPLPLGGGEGQGEGATKAGGPQIDPEGRIWLTIATTRPETIPGDTAVAVNPNDPRYAHLIGKHIVRPLPAELPREQKLIPIIGDEHVDYEFGTGVLKVTPAHDKADFDIGQRHKLAIVEVINADGSMGELAGADLRGLDRFKARKVAEEKLTELGALVEAKPYENNVGFSQRADVPIEPRLSEQWFLKYPAVEQSKACVEMGGTGDSSVPPGDPPGGMGATPRLQGDGQIGSNVSSIPVGGSPAGTGGSPVPRGKMRFHPQRWARVYDHWLTNIQDWCISRQLWWGHRIPVWYNKVGSAALEKPLTQVEQDWNEVSGAKAGEMRRNAYRIAAERGILNSDFRNTDTNWNIYVQKSSLEHAFSNAGLQNIKLVPALPKLLRHAIHLGSEFHSPPSADVRAVHTFIALLKLGFRTYRVKFTVKELAGGRKLYDHQAVELLKKESGSDGKYPPEARLLSKKLAPRPASDPQWKLADLLGDVNTDDELIRVQTECPGPNWEQDPDVLDTWFSSWLWPFATMGWTGNKTQDSNNPTLQAFYPTTDLVTAPDIIFFWVARMIMAGYEYMGELPFQNVYFTGIIRDKQGRKMSKTLGNSPDPLVLIAKYGADALRFGTMRSAPLGQDILFDEKDVELGRNFCNKLWNACRFRQLVGQASSLSGGPGEESGGDATQSLGRDALKGNRQDACPTAPRGEVQGEINPSLLTSDDKWILLKLHQAIKEITDALGEYKFNEATATLYRFFWSEYCDWYVEASKAVFFSSSRRESAQTSGESGESPSGLASAATVPRVANTLAVIDFVLSHTLRLFHPFLPFITEELWQGMGYAEDMPENQGGKTIMNAPWPKPFDGDFRDHYGLDDCYLELAQAKYDLVTAGRNLRRIGNLQSGRKVTYIFKPANPVLPHDAEVIKLLLNADALEIVEDYQPKKGTPTAHTTMGELFLPLEGLVDVGTEKARLTKEKERIEAEILKVEQKLANPSFMQKAPPPVLLEHRQRLADWQAKLAQVQAALAALE